jgi:hypothetical protein
VFEAVHVAVELVDISTHLDLKSDRDLPLLDHLGFTLVVKLSLSLEKEDSLLELVDTVLVESVLGVHGFRALVDQTLKRHVVAKRNFNMLSGYGAFSGDFLELFNFLLSLSISFLGSFLKLLLEFEDHGFLMLVVLDDDLVLFLEVNVLLSRQNQEPI